MKYLIYFFLILVLAGISVGLGPYIKIYGQAPNLLLLLALAWSLEKDNPEFLFMAFFGGLFLDFTAGLPVGSLTLPLLAVALGARLLSENFIALETGGKYLPALLLPAQALFYLGFFVCGWLAFKMKISPLPPDTSHIVKSFIVAFIYNLALLYPVSILAGSVRHYVRRHFEREYKLK